MPSLIYRYDIWAAVAECLLQVDTTSVLVAVDLGSRVRNVRLFFASNVTRWALLSRLGHGSSLLVGLSRRELPQGRTTGRVASYAVSVLVAIEGSTIQADNRQSVWRSK